MADQVCEVYCGRLDQPAYDVTETDDGLTVVTETEPVERQTHRDPTPEEVAQYEADAVADAERAAALEADDEAREARRTQVLETLADATGLDPDTIRDVLVNP